MKSEQRGFTLIETLAALMIVALFTVWIAQMTAAGARFTDRADALTRAAALAQDAMALALMRQDLSGDAFKNLKTHAGQWGLQITVKRIPMEKFPRLERISVLVEGGGLPAPLKLERLQRVVEND
jgi:prepilin-type N-terminal cleavage/methylation domain-containing protein